MGKASSTKVNSSCDFKVSDVHYRTIWQSVEKIYKTEGVNAFGRGMLARMAINVPSTALSWGTYEVLKGVFIKK